MNFKKVPEEQKSYLRVSESYRKYRGVLEYRSEWRRNEYKEGRKKTRGQWDQKKVNVLFEGKVEFDYP